ncbi:thioredoxin domain-containing protein [Subtercola sp. RTI3]|uniref:thioredoxin domain-containing protein n=1 Tax=Subtercola sp. RTI3 TaxID=3048639 RepID=UPI002B2272F3|nr:DUF255 domain-containing protein [Subtercola sp. RTI3]MEA9985581.1 DUF255 domain-containing protein [Subtercola sp. RTI3]
MANRLGDAISPYLRSHADNPVDWFSWGEAAFAEAERRDVPVLVSIGYSTCHWCHVMARESFSDPALAEVLNRGFVAIKVDREEHPEVDAVYLAAAGAFTQNLGWPLNVFVTPEGKPFFAGTYSPPVAVQGNPSFGQVLGAVSDAWQTRRDDVESTARQLTAALVAVEDADQAVDALPTPAQLEQVVLELDDYEDTVNGGFGGAPKFPVAPVLKFLQAMDAPVATRALQAMAASDLRDRVEGGFFRYATRADWSEPHYERMLYDNALLLDAYTAAAVRYPGEQWATDTAAGIASFLVDVLQVDGGAFAAAQDSESLVDGTASEGGYYALNAAQRVDQPAPARDLKILTGLNGLAIAALARASAALSPALTPPSSTQPGAWLAAAVAAADYLLGHHLRPDGTLVRASLGERTSDARATLEDYGMFAEALLALAAVTGDERYSRTGRDLVDKVLDAGFATPGGGDPVLAARGLLIDGDVSEGAYPSGTSAVSAAAYALYLSTGEQRYRAAVVEVLTPLSADALSRPIGFGASLEIMLRLSADA